MDTTSSILRVLTDRSKEQAWPCMSSIMVRNKDIPFFPMDKWLDYEWQLMVIKGRKCCEVPPCVIRSARRDNLSLDGNYRREDYNRAIELASPIGRKRINASRARYFYKIGQYSDAREYLWLSPFTVKNTMYFFTSFIPPLARWVTRHFRVF